MNKKSNWVSLMTIIKTYILKTYLKKKIRFDEIIELIEETNFDDLIYIFEGDSNRKRFDVFKNKIKLFEKKYGDMKLDKPKNV